MVTTRRKQREEDAKRKREESQQTLKSICNSIRKRGKTLSSTLSNDIIRDILSRVPVEDLLRFKFACKSWYTLLHEPFFIRLHLNQTITNYKIAFMIYDTYHDIYSVDCDISSSSLKFSKPVKIDGPTKARGLIRLYGSCNGMFLIETFRQFRRICLWNPFTREYKDPPDFFSKIPEYECLPPFFTIEFFLGYDISRDDYKVIRYPYYHYSKSGIKSNVDVYSARTNSCKRIQDVPYYIFGSVFPNIVKDNGIFLNGAIHWFGRQHVSDIITSGFSLNIVSFDLANDEFKDLQLPDMFLDTKSKQLGVLEDCLCIYHVYKDNYIDVLMMKEYGVKESWTKMFSITDQPIQCMRIFEPMCVTKDGKVLVRWNHKDLALYDPKHGGLRCGKFKIQGLPRYYLSGSHICTYIKSLVSFQA